MFLAPIDDPQPGIVHLVPARAIKQAAPFCIELSLWDSLGLNSLRAASMDGERMAFQSRCTRKPFISTQVKPTSL
jgi:hypothetical protein